MLVFVGVTNRIVDSLFSTVYWLKWKSKSCRSTTFKKKLTHSSSKDTIPQLPLSTIFFTWSGLINTSKTKFIKKSIRFSAVFYLFSSGENFEDFFGSFGFIFRRSRPGLYDWRHSANGLSRRCRQSKRIDRKSPSDFVFLSSCRNRCVYSLRFLSSDEKLKKISFTVGLFESSLSSTGWIVFLSF